MKNVERIPAKFNLPVDLTERLAETVPSGQRSRFVAKAIEEALNSEAKQRLLDMLDSLPARSTGGKDSVEVLRQLREERMNRLTGRHTHLSQ